MDKESIVKAEYAAAKREGRQPRCPYCTAVLGVRQVSRHETYWRWNGKRFEKRIHDEVSEPYCVNCQALDWQFIDNDFVRLCEHETLFVLTEEDAQIMAEQMEIEPLTEDQIRQVRKGVESGLDGWSDALEYAIREAVRA
jgi:hypothetical protein